MICFTTGNLLDADAEALVNTVNTVGVMGKGIAMMFRDKFPGNTRLYEEACLEGRMEVGRILVTEASDMYGPRWIVNFPTKKHWRNPSKIEWVRSGLQDMARFIRDSGVKSVALPPLGAGNGGLDWATVRAVIEEELSSLEGVDILVYEPTPEYQNVAKRSGVEKLTPARALIAEIVRRYWILGIECTLLEVQKLAWFIESEVKRLKLDNPLKLDFKAHRYGPYADNLRHMLNSLDGSYLQCDKRISDAGPFEVIRFNDAKRDVLGAYFTTAEAKPYRPALEATTQLIDGFESPLGMELLATVDWLLTREKVDASVEAVQAGLRGWAGGGDAARRKEKIFESRLIELSLQRLVPERAEA